MDSLRKSKRKLGGDKTGKGDHGKQYGNWGRVHIFYTFAYDANRRLTNITDSNARTTTYQYDAVGNKISMTMPDATIIKYTYDQNNRLTRINANTLSFAFTYDNLQRRTTLLYPNGITANYTYDALSRPTNLIYKTSSNSIIDSFAYTYDSINNKLTATDPAGNHQYQYDAIYRLTTAHHTSMPYEAYTYDGTGNRLTDAQARSYAYNNANELLSQDSTAFTYDANGNLTNKTDTTGTTIYQYDYENRLIKATMPNATTAEYKYDPFGRRIQKKITDTSGIKTYTYTYDNEDIILETLTTSSQQLTTRYIHGPGIDEPLAIQHSSADYYYHADALGSITRMTDQNGNIVQTYKYDSFGNITASSILQPYAYTGREYDKETGLYYYRARYYDPRTGRFITKDPIGFGGGVNFYSYVNNRPTRFVDPWGLSGIVYDRSDGKIYITPSGAGIPILQYPAGNNTTNPTSDPLTPDSYGPVPTGTYPMGNYIPTGNDINSPFGTGFIPIYLPPRDIPLKPRSGVGLHCGRANRGGPQARTRGCIRTTCEAMDYLQGDPPTTIDIVE